MCAVCWSSIRDFSFLKILLKVFLASLSIALVVSVATEPVLRPQSRSDVASDWQHSRNRSGSGPGRLGSRDQLIQFRTGISGR